MLKTFLTLILMLTLGSIGVFAQEMWAGTWEHYETETFSLEFPAHWRPVVRDNLLELIYEGYGLRFYTGEAQMGLPAGDFERRKLIGQYGLPMDVLVYDGLDKAILYGRLSTPATELTILLEVMPTSDLPYEALDLPAEIAEQANFIISTLTIKDVKAAEISITPFFSGEENVIDSWQTFTHASEPFGFRYPETWTLSTAPGQVILTRDIVKFIIAFSAADEDPPVADVRLMVISAAVPRVPIYGLHQAIDSQLLSPRKDGAFAVLYRQVSTPDNHFVMWVSAGGSPEGTVNFATMDEIDMIISTFKTRPPQAVTE